MNASLLKKLKNIKLLILDVDGILTSGEIVVDERGKETKVFNVQDGFGVVLLRRAGFKTAILSARSAPCVTYRAKDLGFTKVVQNAQPKIKAYKKLIKQLKVKDSEVCFLGDDLPDLEVLKKVGLSVSVPNGRIEVKRQVDYVTKHEGGKGAVREIVEMILIAQGKWADILKKYGN